MIDKKEIKRKYKETIQPMGIYQIRNLVTGKILVGSSKNLPAKSNSYIFQLDAGGHMNRELQADYTKFGRDNFVFEILDRLEPKEDISYDYTKDLETLEELWLEKLQPYNDKGYNALKRNN